MRISELENKLKKHAKIAKSAMQVPFDLKEEIKNVKKRSMRSVKNSKVIKRVVAIAAVLSICIITVTMVSLASPIKGFFKDIIGFGGAITGTRYENATNDIKVDVLELRFENDNVIISLGLTFENSTEAPFLYIQEVAIAEYKILDSGNKEIVKSKLSASDAKKGTVSNGKAIVNLSINDKELKSGKEYTILIEKMYGLAKADAPLHIIGNWKNEFIK